MAFDFFGLICDLKNCKFCGVIPTVAWLAVGGVDYFFAECSCAHEGNPFGRICESGYKTETLESRDAVIKDWNEKQSLTD